MRAQCCSGFRKTNIQSKMRHSKNNSSICQTTTLLSMSNVSAESSELPSFRRQHGHLIEKLEELTLILQTTLAQGKMLANHRHQLQDCLAQRKATLDRMNRMAPHSEEESNDEEMGVTCRINYKGEGIAKASMGRTIKHHQKFYSAIQSPTVNYSPQRTPDQFTLHSYQKSRYYPQTAMSTKSGIIRKQRDQFRPRQTPSNRSPKQRDFESIEEIWNEANHKKGIDQKTASYKRIKTFL